MSEYYEVNESNTIYAIRIIEPVLKDIRDELKQLTGLIRDIIELKKW